MTRLAPVILLALTARASADMSFAADKNVTWDSSKDPEVAATLNDATFTQAAACSSISICGSKVILKIESPHVINGNGNVAMIGTPDELAAKDNKKKAKAGTKPSGRGKGTGKEVQKEKPRDPETAGK